MKIKQIFMDKPIYLGLSIFEISKIVMYEFWYPILCYMDTDSFIV